MADEYTFRRGANTKQVSIDGLRKSFQGLLSTSLNISTLIGSGASVPAIPLMGATFERMKKAGNKDERVKSLKEMVEKYAQSCNVLENEVNNIEDFLSWLECYLTVNPQDTHAKTARDYVLEEFRQSVCLDYSTDELAVTNVLANYLDFVQGLGFSRQILAQSKSPMFDIVNLFTTNYDFFHEIALTESGYQYSDGFTNGIESRFSTREFHQRPIDLEDRFREHLQPVNPFFRLFKLHGSLNWIGKNNNVKRLPQSVVELPQSVVEKVVQGEDLLIMPTSSKYAVTQGSPFSDMFREFFNALSTPNSILITSGFSFGDQHISELIRQALMRTDFTLYAFISRRESGKPSNPAQDFADSNSSPNAIYIYPKDRSDYPYFCFSEVARIMKPEPEIYRDKREEGGADERSE